MIPFVVREALVEAIRTCFWYKNKLRALVIQAGVPERYFDAKTKGPLNTSLSKTQYMRTIIDELADKGEDGREVFENICREIACLDGPVDRDNLDDSAAKLALTELRRQMSLAQISQKRPMSEPVAAGPTEGAAKTAKRDAELERIKTWFFELHAFQGTPQARGYKFQDLVGDLFRAHDIPYSPPSRSPGQETDGFFQFQDKHFLVEARWRKDESNFNDLSHFRSKVMTRLHGTYGFFISLEGFGPEATQLLAQLGDKCVLLIDGTEFLKIIDQRISLPDALSQMIHEAHKRGTFIVKLRL